MRISAATLVLFMAGVLGGTPSALAAAAAAFPEIAFDAGEVRQGVVVAHDFVVRNPGDAPLRITEVTPGCSCTVARFDAVVNPDGEGRISVRVETAELPAGPVSKTVTVTSDAPGAERTVLQVKLTVVPTLEFLPHNPVYLVSEQGVGRQERVLLRVHEDGVRAVGVASSNPAIRASLSPATPGPEAPAGGAASPVPRAGDYWIALAVAPDAPTGRQLAEITVQTSAPERAAGALKVEVLVKERGASSSAVLH